MGNEFDVKYFDGLLNKNKASKKQIAVYLDEAKIERIDMITKTFSSISDSRSFSRNTLIEGAIDKYLAEAEKYLLERQGIDIERLLEEEQEKFDTVLLASKERGFEETFLGECEEPCWYPCRISDTREGKLKYIAIYRGEPISAITHYAKIKEIVYDQNKGCKVCHFEGAPIELQHKVGLRRNKDSCFFVGTKYTSLESLLNASYTDELVCG